jgi:hypothetical protein
VPKRIAGGHASGGHAVDVRGVGGHDVYLQTDNEHTT